MIVPCGRIPALGAHHAQQWFSQCLRRCSYFLLCSLRNNCGDPDRASRARTAIFVVAITRVGYADAARRVGRGDELRQERPRHCARLVLDFVALE
jgi:hypothetical protein